MDAYVLYLNLNMSTMLQSLPETRQAPVLSKWATVPSTNQAPAAEATDWLDEVVERAKAKYQAQRAQEDRLLQEETLKAKLAAKYCEELFAWLQTIDVKFNNRFGSQVLAVSPVGSNGDTGVQVLARPLRAQEKIAVLSYQKDGKSLGLNTDCGSTDLPQVINFVVLADGVLVAEIGVEQYLPEQLGRKIINDLLDIDSMHPVAVPRSSGQTCCSTSCNDLEFRDRPVVAGGSNGGSNGDYATALA